MRFILPLALIGAATAAAAQDEATFGGVSVTTSYNISAPMTAKTAAELTAEEQGYRRQMYVQSSKECADLMATIAKTCAVTNISVSTQITRQPGIPDQIYATGNVTMQVEMK